MIVADEYIYRDHDDRKFSCSSSMNGSGGRDGEHKTYKSETRRGDGLRGQGWKWVMCV